MLVALKLHRKSDFDQKHGVNNKANFRPLLANSLEEKTWLAFIQPDVNSREH